MQTASSSARRSKTARTDAPVAPAAAAATPPSFRGTETILLVEDEDLLRPLPR